MNTPLKRDNSRFAPAVDYRKFRLSKLKTNEFKHLKYLLFWPLFGIMFQLTEHFFVADSYYPVHCSIDDIIPFNELFIIPYIFWFIYLIGMNIYTLLYDPEAFEKMMKFTIATYTVTIVIYLVFPTCQNLRPLEFARDNILTQLMSRIYAFDTNTNVCPSLHVIGSVAVMVTALHAKSINSRKIKAGFVVSAILICMSTVFLKQHSVFDIIAAIPVCMVGSFMFFHRKRM